MNQESHIISQQVFGSSKKLQFIRISSTMDSVSPSSHDDNTHQLATSPKSNTFAKRSMSIESMLDSNGSPEYEQRHLRISPPTPTMKRPLLPSAYDDRLHKHRRHDENTKPMHVEQQQQQPQKATLTCYHAAVAQKSYGSEKRFLCPPPMITLEQHHSSTVHSPTIAMSVLAEGTDRPVEQCTSLDENKRASFKYLHVTGSSKTKQFCLRVNMTYASLSCATATFFSSPISIISKPSKKTAKARNVSSCIFTTSQISLYNRINSQTVRTKYLTTSSTSVSSSSLDSEQQQLCAKNSSWSAFDIILVHQPTPPPPPPQNQSLTYYNQQQYHHNHQLSVTTAGVPLTYGSHIILKDSQLGVCSPRVIIRKVEKATIATCALGPVSQMQKIALQLASSVDSPDGPVYLSSNGNIIEDTNHSDDQDENSSSSSSSSNSSSGSNHAHSSTWLDHYHSKRVPDPKSTTGALIEKADDCFCWTIVGIAKFVYTVVEPSITPTPSTEPSQPLSPSSTLSIPNQHINKHQPPIQQSRHHHHQQQQHRQQEIMPRLLQPSPPPSPPRTIVPFPMVSSVCYKENQHCLDLVGQHLVQHLPSSTSPHLLEFWLGGAYGPLPVIHQNQKQHQYTVTQGNIQLELELPNTQDFLIAHHDLLVKKAQGDRCLELPLLMVRKDNVIYHTGKSIVCHVECNGDTRWTIVDVNVTR